MRSTTQVPPVMSFGPFELDVVNGELRKFGVPLKIYPQAFQVLTLLVCEAGRTVPREEIQRQVWGNDTFVDFERGTNFCISHIRAVLEDNAEKPRYIQTLPRRGYRFIAPVNGRDQTETPSEHSVAPLPSRTAGNGNDVGDGWRSSKMQVERTSLHNKWPTLGFVAVPVAVMAIFFIVRDGGITPNEARLTRLTANLTEDPVTSGAVSPDGKYLAFTDKAGRIRVQIIATGQVQSIPQFSVNDRKIDLEIGPWFPDSTRFLVNAHTRNPLPTELSHSNLDGASISVVSLVPQSKHKLRDEALAMSISPDGSLVAFGAIAGGLGYREVWVTDASGQHARKLFGVTGTNVITTLKWSPDGQRAITFERNDTSGAIVARELMTGSLTSLVRFSDTTNLGDYVWLSDGRLIYSLNDALGRQCLFWKLQVDPRTGEPIGKPQEILKVDGFCVGSITATADAKQLTFRRWLHEDTTYLADLSAGGALITSSVRHLTQDDYPSSAEAWTRDGKAVVFRSRRGGHTTLYKQPVDADSAESLVGAAQDVAASTISPDGSLLFYEDCSSRIDCNKAVPLRHIPILGGTPKLVLISNTYGRPRCAMSPSDICAIAEQSEDGQPIIFTAFGPISRGRELQRFEAEPGAAYNWGLAPDGSRIAVLKVADSNIHVLYLNGQHSRTVRVEGWDNLATLYWAADGKGWFTSSMNPGGSVLLHVDSNGAAQRLWEQREALYAYGLPSPDGRHLAIVSTISQSNIWMLDSF